MVKKPEDLPVAIANLGHDYAGWLMGLNEPAMDYELGNVTLEMTAQTMRAIEEAFPKAKLLGTAVFEWFGPNCGNGTIFTHEQIVDKYVAMYGGLPRIDAIAVHTYGAKGRRDNGTLIDQSQMIINYAAAVKTRYHAMGIDAPIWVTEFGLTPTEYTVEYYSGAWRWRHFTFTDADVAELVRKVAIGLLPIAQRIAPFPSNGYISGGIDWGRVAMFRGGALTPAGVAYRDVTGRTW